MEDYHLKKILATIVIILLIVALGFSVLAATHSNQSDSNQTQSNKKKDKKKLL